MARLNRPAEAPLTCTTCMPRWVEAPVITSLSVGESSAPSCVRISRLPPWAA
ncbi:Uncharacterised protein [Bordetella pertussis]|nr:Uncharacterised protein [Bordetella pertussis]